MSRTTRPRSGFVTGPAAGEAWAAHALGHAFGGFARKADAEGYTLHGLRHEHLVTTQRDARLTESDLRDAIARLGGPKTVTDAVTAQSHSAKSGIVPGSQHRETRVVSRS